MFEDRTMTPDREAIADATTEAIDRLSRGVSDALDQADEARDAAVERGRSLLDRLRATLDGLASTLRSAWRSAERSAERAGDTTAQSIHETRKRARASADAAKDVARSTADDTTALGGRALRTAAVARESVKHAAEGATDVLHEAMASLEGAADVDRARQLLGDAIAGSAADRLRGRRTSGRMRAGLVATGVAAGAAATWFLDSERGPERRRSAMAQLRRWSRSASDRLESMAHDTSTESRNRAAAMVSGTAVLAIGLARGGLLGITAATGGALVALGGATNIGPGRILGLSTSDDASGTSFAAELPVDELPAGELPVADAWHPTSVEVVSEIETSPDLVAREVEWRDPAAESIDGPIESDESEGPVGEA